VIKNEKDGYNVYSEEGKHLGGPYKTREEADMRLREVEYFKKHKDSADPITAMRYDATQSLGKAERTQQGGLKVPAYVTRTGVFKYKRSDGSIQRELRHPEEVFHADSIRSLEDATLTHLHPGRVTPQNFKAVSIGHVRSAAPDTSKKFVDATTIVQDAKAIEGVARGDLSEVSCGYTCDVVMGAGTYDGESYDARQVNIRYNHVALGPKNWGRAGNAVKLRLDSDDAIEEGVVTDTSQPERDTQVDIEKIDGIEYKVGSAEHTQALRKQRDAATARADAADKALDESKGREDGLKKQVETLKTDLATASDPKRLSDAVSARIAVEKQGASVLGNSVKLDGLTDREIMVKAISAKDSSFKCDDKTSDDYLRGRFDTLVASAPKTTSEKIAEGLNGALNGTKQDSKEPSRIGPKDQSAEFDNHKFPVTK
jgi:hypothetical protein